MPASPPIEPANEFIETGPQVRVPHPVTNASRHTLRPDQVWWIQGKTSVPGDTHPVQVGGNAGAAAPAVGSDGGVGSGSGFDELPDVDGFVRGHVGQSRTTGRVSIPGFECAVHQHRAVVAAALPTGRRIVPGPEGKAGIVNFNQTCQRVAFMFNHRRAQCAGRAAWRCGTSLSHAASEAQSSRWNGSPSDTRPGTRRSVAACWRAAVSRPSPTSASRSRRTRRYGTSRAVPFPCHDRVRDRRNRPASASRSTRRRRPCRPGTDNG